MLSILIIFEKFSQQFQVTFILSKKCFQIGKIVKKSHRETQVFVQYIMGSLLSMFLVVNAQQRASSCLLYKLCEHSSLLGGGDSGYEQQERGPAGSRLTGWLMLQRIKALWIVLPYIRPSRLYTKLSNNILVNSKLQLHKRQWKASPFPTKYEFISNCTPWQYTEWIQFNIFERNKKQS